MAEQKVELRKVRDFGENLNDTILFIRQNFKPLLSSFLAIAGIFMLASAVISGIFQNQIGDILKEVLNRRNPGGMATFYSIGDGYYLVLLFGWLNFVAMEVAVISYIKVYEIKGETPVIQEVWGVFKRYFFKVFFYSIPIGLITAIGLLFCIAPGIFLMVIFVPFSAILMIEDTSFGDAYNRCFRLIKNNFWISLLIYLLTYIIAAVSAGIISLFVGSATGLISYFTTSNLNATINLVSSILDIFSFIFYIVYYVSVTLHYYNLVEKHDGTGLMRKLDSIGNTGQNFDNIQEQY